MDGARFKRSRAETDQKILAYLEIHPYGPTRMVADAARLTETTAQKHLYQLEQEGKVVSEQKLNHRTGRTCTGYAVKPGTNHSPTQADLEEPCQRSS